MSDNPYDRPPITEAVIEFRSNREIDSKHRKSALKKFKKIYEQHNTITDRTFSISVTEEEANTDIKQKIFDKYSSSDMTQQLSVLEKSLVVSRLSPYSGWEKFRRRVLRDWQFWNTNAGFLPVSQLGMRYINRIDIPSKDGEFEHAKYVTVRPQLPAFITSTHSHLVKVQAPLDDLKAVLHLTVARTESPLPNCAAILLDIDIVKQFENPPNQDMIFQELDCFRSKKNEVFESCITESARKLFN